MKRVTILALVLVALVACGGPSEADLEATVQARIEQTQAAQPTNTPVPPTDTPIPPTATPQPTDTPTPEPTATPLPPTETPTPVPTDTPEPSLSQDELIEKWQTPISIAAFLIGGCEAIVELAEERIAEGENNPGFELVGMGLVMGIVEEALQSWTPYDDQTAIKESFESYYNQTIEISGEWADQNMTPDNVAAELRPVCDEITASFEELALLAVDDGITQESFEMIFAELEELASELEESGDPESVTEIVPTETPAPDSTPSESLYDDNYLEPLLLTLDDLPAGWSIAETTLGLTGDETATFFCQEQDVTDSLARAEATYSAGPNGPFVIQIIVLKTDAMADHEETVSILEACGGEFEPEPGTTWTYTSMSFPLHGDALAAIQISDVEGLQGHAIYFVQDNFALSVIQLAMDEPDIALTEEMVSKIVDKIENFE